LEIWSQIQTSQHIWNFDATGSIIEAVENQSKPYLYSMVCHDEQNNTIIPMAEFVTTSHKHLTVSSYLFVVKKYFEKYCKPKSDFVLAPVIVTDFSWTLITSILESFNSMNIIKYLDSCFEIIINKNNSNILKTIIYLCAAHFIKLIIKKVKKNEPEISDKIKKSFVFSFSLLQNATSFIEFECFFIHILHMFNTPTINNTVQDSANFIKKALRSRDSSDLAYLDYESNDSQEEINREKNFELLLYLDNNQKQTIGTVRNSSKFHSYFQNKFESHSKLVKIYDNKDKINPFYSPKLVQIIMKYIYVMPLWSGIMLNTKTCHLVNFKTKKRTTNNPVENHFQFNKNSMLNKRLRVKPSEFVAPNYRFILSKYIQFYLKDTAQEKKVKQEIVDHLERWKDKKDSSHVKGFFYQNIAHFDTLGSNVYTREVIEDNNMIEISVNSNSVNNIVNGETLNFNILNGN
jgi:hypothetical protein